MKEIVEYMLTTIDNPYNPFTEFDEWFVYDTQNNYFSCSLLARFACTSTEMSEYENQEELNSAIDRILELDLTGMYKKVCRADFKQNP
jgi:hypothetical protein